MAQLSYKKKMRREPLDSKQIPELSSSTPDVELQNQIDKLQMEVDILKETINVLKKYSSYRGEISLEVENIIARDFHSEPPNKKWLTDITEFSLPAGKVYLSPIVDCFDGFIVSWSVGTRPNAELVNTMLDTAIAHLKKGEVPLIHTDRGCHYRWPGWLERMDRAGTGPLYVKEGLLSR